MVFNIVFIVTVLLGIASLFLLVKKNKYGRKPLIITSVSFVIALAISIPLGNLPTNYFDPDKKTEEEVDEWYEENIAAKEETVTSDYVEEDILEAALVEPILTKSETNQINKGMTYDEVVAIIGEEGTLERESRMDYGIHTAYKWENDDDGGYAFIQFIDKNTGTPVVSSFVFEDIPDIE